MLPLEEKREKKRRKTIGQAKRDLLKQLARPVGRLGVIFEGKLSRKLIRVVL